jgi:hypothetical protein
VFRSTPHIGQWARFAQNRQISNLCGQPALLAPNTDKALSVLSGTSFFTDSELSVSESIVIDFRYRQSRTHGDAGDPARRNRRHLCPHKESHHAGAKRLNRIASVDTIEELLWQAVSESLPAS